MTSPAGDPATDDAWSGDRVARWLRQANGLEVQLAPVSQLLFAAATIAPGEHVLDVGCGTGPTTREAAGLAGPAGRVTGLDVSGDMLAAAAAVPTADSAPIDWVEADVVAWDPPGSRFDAVISRFGVMFFSDPPAAVGNLASATRPGGRLAVAVWAERDVSPLFEVSYRAALAVLATRGVTPPPLSPYEGPFSWRDPEQVTAMLTGGGWREVQVDTHTLLLPFGGELDPEAAASAALDFGPTRLVLVAADEPTRGAARTAIAAAFADHADSSGHVVLEATVRIVTAQR